MALTERPPSEQIVRAYLDTIKLLDDLNQADPLISIHLPVFVLGLANLAKGAIVQGVRETGWQCFSIGLGGVTSGDVTKSDTGLPVASRSRGSSVDKIYAAYEQLKNLDIDLVRNVNVQYEPVALRIPGLHIEALWLRKKPFSEGVDHDYVVPFHTLDRNLAAKLLFTMPEFLDIARPLARKQLAVIPPRD